MPSKYNQGLTGSAIAAGTIAVNLLVQRTSVAGKVDVCGASGVPQGSVQDAYATGDTVLYYRTVGMALVTASAAVAIGDFVKAAAAGKVAPEATVTTRTAATIGIAITAASGDGVTFEMEWL